VQVLLQYGADCNLTGVGRPRCTQKGCVESMRLLLSDPRIDSEQLNDADDINALHMAADNTWEQRVYC